MSYSKPPRANQGTKYLYFFNCYLAVPRPTLGHSLEVSLTNPMLISALSAIFTQKSPGAYYRLFLLQPLLILVITLQTVFHPALIVSL